MIILKYGSNFFRFGIASIIIFVFLSAISVFATVVPTNTEMLSLFASKITDEDKSSALVVKTEDKNIPLGKQPTLETRVNLSQTASSVFGDVWLTWKFAVWAIVAFVLIGISVRIASQDKNPQ